MSVQHHQPEENRMNRQDYKEAAEELLKRADKVATQLGGASFATNQVQNLTSIARVYAMLAAIPDVQDMRGEVHDRRPDSDYETLTSKRRMDGPGDLTGHIGR
jgi:hypothetical protein